MSIFWKKVPKRKTTYFKDSSSWKMYSCNGFLNDIKQVKVKKSSSLFNYFK
jgi:hypothetical protein